MGTPAKCLPVSTLSTIQKVSCTLIGHQSATALGATWDTQLVEEVGLKILSEEAKLRAVSSVNGPTCNIQRVSLHFQRYLALLQHVKTEPIGRASELLNRQSQWAFYSPEYKYKSFESFSEDPFLCGMMAASYVNGVQKGGIGTAIKHFVYVIQPTFAIPTYPRFILAQMIKKTIVVAMTVS